MKWIKKLAKALLVLLFGLLALFAILYMIYNKPLPKGESGEKAIELMERIQLAINQPAWDTTRYIEWTFNGSHDFIWDKERHYVQVRWAEHRVLLNPNTIEGIAFKNGKRVEDEGLLEKANLLFINDAFWLNAPAQMSGNRDVKLEAITLENQREALLITYLSGGKTPGDSYLWKFDENGRPEAWQLWLKLFPIGGFEFKWSEWTTLETGAMVSTLREGPVDIKITNLNSYQKANEDIFAELDLL
jgi:hypothetical protein